MQAYSANICRYISQSTKPHFCWWLKVSFHSGSLSRVGRRKEANSTPESLVDWRISTAGLTFSGTRKHRLGDLFSLLQKYRFSAVWGKWAPTFQDPYGYRLCRRFMVSSETVQEAWCMANPEGHTWILLNSACKPIERMHIFERKRNIMISKERILENHRIIEPLNGFGWKGP